MNLPFTQQQFFDVFARYNETVWPAQVVLNAVALACVGLVFRENSGRWISGLLAGLWFWAALAYHFAFFSRINPAAWLFGVVAFSGGVVFLWLGGLRGALRFSFAPDWRSIAGSLLIVYALAVYPAVGAFAGHRYPGAPTFGVPCPTTIFTLGVLLLASPPVPRLAFLVPVLWAAVGSFAAFSLGVIEDYGLPAAGGVAIIAMMLRPRRAGSRA